MHQPSDAPRTAARRPYRPPIGIPTPGEPRAQATAASLSLHLLFVLLLLGPTLLYSTRLVSLNVSQGAGGSAPAGGGGGGRMGQGLTAVRFTPEHLQYVQVAPPEPRPKETSAPVKAPRPEPVKPVPPPEPVPVPAPTLVQPSPAAAVSAAGLDVKGDGLGTGRDGSAGNGPGSGGGVGSGVGTGRGSGSGPGTGGGKDVVYPPTVVSLPILPLPVPDKVRPYRMVAEFAVDSTGNARLLRFNPSRDAAYNRRIREMLGEIRFRPAVRVDGTPVAATAIVTAEAM